MMRRCEICNKEVRRIYVLDCGSETINVCENCMQDPNIYDEKEDKILQIVEEFI